MHIGLITHVFPPEFLGGTEAVVLAQARALAERGHRVDVVCGTDVPLPQGGAEVVHDLIGGVRVHRLPRTAAERGEDPLANPMQVRPRLRDLVLELLGGADLVHVHHWSNLDASLVRALAPRMPVAVTLHDAYSTCPRFFRHAPKGIACPDAEGLFDLARRTELEACARCLAPDLDGGRGALGPLEAVDTLLEPLSQRAGAFEAELRAASLLIAPSRGHAAPFAQLSDARGQRLQVVPHGLCRGFERLPSALRPAPPQKLVIAHFGNLCADKGTLDLVRTLSLLPRDRIELRFAGRSVDAEVDRAVAKHRRANLVRMEAYDDASLRGFLAGSHLAAFPSRLDESYGLVVDEALAMGLPAWVSDRGAPPERLRAWGLPGRILPAGDPLAWAEALRSVLAAPHTVLEQRARIPDSLPTAGDAVRMLEGLYGLVGARSAA